MRHTLSHIEQRELQQINIDQYRYPDLYIRQQGVFIAVHRYWELDEPLSNVSLGIRVFDNTYWNHTAIGLIRQDGTVMVMESNSQGVIWEPFSVWATRYGNKIWQLYPPLVDLPLEAYTQYLGRKYDYASLLFYQPIYKTTGLWLGRTGEAGAGRTYCTEILSYAAGLDRPYLTTTADVVELYQQRGIKPIKYKTIV